MEPELNGITAQDEQQLPGETPSCEELPEEELSVCAPAEEVPDERGALIEKLSQRLAEAEIKIVLLESGAAREKLTEASALTAGLCRTGRSPESAAAEILAAYPHLKAIKREIPQLSAGSSGSADGFSAVRRIFSSKY